MRRTIVVGMVWMLTAVAAAANADVIITEIMYNPASNEQPPARTEWVELYNIGQEAVDLTGWYLEDEDGQTTLFEEGSMIQPGQAVVVIPVQATVSEFKAAWGEDVVVIAVDGWARPGISGLANSPDEENEKLKLVRSDGTVSDGVNFDDEGAWPGDDPDGPSIYLIAGALDAESNDDGANWRRSEAGVDEALVCDPTQVFDGADIGSPGRVALTSDVTEPADTPETDDPNEPNEPGY